MSRVKEGLGLALFTVIGMAGCGGGGGSDTDPAPNPNPQPSIPDPAARLASDPVTTFTVVDGYNNQVEAATTTTGEVSIDRIEYGQALLQDLASPYFLLLSNRDVKIRVLVKGDRAGLQAPALKLTVTDQGGTAKTMLLAAKGALPVSETRGPDLSRSYLYTWVAPVAGS